ncbi:MAG: thioesterase family protein [Bacteroidia bacterium]
MYSFDTQLRVRYSETDRMGYLYYGNYATFYEVGRVEAMRSLGLSYKELEDQGILLPVRDLQSRFLKPAYYDELLRVRTTIPEMPGLRIVFKYEIFRQDDELINLGETTLVFIDAGTKRPVLPPVHVKKLFDPYFT